MVQTKRSSEGFTLFEIMIAIAILGGLIALFYPMITRYQKRGAIQTARLLLGNLKNSINMYKTDTGEYPNTLEDLARKPSDPKVASKWVSEYASEKDINPSQGRLDYQKNTRRYSWL